MSNPIIAIDHLSVSVANLDAETANYIALLDREPRWRGRLESRNCTVFDAGNLQLRLVESQSPLGLDGLCFAVDDGQRMQRRLARAGIDSVPASSEDAGSGKENVTSPIAAGINTISPGQTRGLSLSYAQGTNTAAAGAESGVTGLDHVVIRSSDSTGTGFMLAAQLGLDMRMDMNRPEWGARLMFFRCGDLIVEVMQPLEKEHTGEGGDSDGFYGLSWRVADAQATRQRLEDSGFDVSPVRKGRKPGTAVFTVRDRTAGVATLMIQPA